MAQDTFALQNRARGVSLRLLPQKGQKFRRFWNLSRMIAAAVLIAVSIAIASVTWMSASQSREGLLQQFAQSTESISELMAANIGGAVKFGKAEILQTQFEAFLVSQQGEANYIAAYKQDGSEIVNVGVGSPVAAELAAGALSGEETRLGENGFERASLVRFGKKNDLVGVLVVGWSHEGILEAHADGQRLSVLFGAIVALVFCCIVFSAFIA